MPQQQNGRVSAPRCGLACAWGLAALILAVMGTPSVVCADPLDTVVVKDLGLVGGREAVWVYRYRIEGEDDLRLLRFAYRLTDERAPQRFRGLVGLGAVNGRIAAAAVSGNDFHVIFADGAHRRYGRRPGDVQLNLPDACAPLALAGDAAEQVVYALVPTVVAVQLPETAAPDQPQPATTPVAEDVVATEPEPDETSPPFSIVRFARGAWHRDRLGPDALRLRSPCWLSADRGRLTLVIAGQSGDGGVRHVSSDGEGWDAPVTIPGVEATDILTLVSEDEKVALVTISMGRGANAAVLWFSDEGIARRDVLEESAGAVAAGQLGQQLVLAFDGAGGESQIGVWPLHGGPPSEQPAEIPALVPRPRAWIDSETVVLAYAGMGALVIVVVARRRRSIAVPAQLPEGHTLAPYSRRALGFVLDGLIFSPVAVLILSPSLSVVLQARASGETPDYFPFLGQMTVEDFVRWLVAAGLFVVYACILEGFWGATLGKRLVRCRVVTEQGLPCPWPAVILRNAARMVEMFPPFDLMPAIVLVLVTLNRQRLGDLVGRTVVVEQVGPTARPNRER